MALVCDRCTQTIRPLDRREALHGDGDICGNCYYRDDPCVLCDKDTNYHNLRSGNGADEQALVLLAHEPWRGRAHLACVLQVARTAALERIVPK